MHGASVVQRVIEHVTVSSQLIGMDSRDVRRLLFRIRGSSRFVGMAQTQLDCITSRFNGTGSTRLVNELANHQGQQIYFGIAAINGHDADLACSVERNSPPAFARPRGKASIPKIRWYVRLCIPRGLIGTVPSAPHSRRARNFSTRRAERSHRWPIVD